MKRKAIFSLMLLACLVTGILGMNQIKNKDVVADDVQVKPCEASSDNATINRLIKVWKGKSREAFDNYFADYSDEQRIIADEEGGILAYADGYSDEEESQNSYIQYEDGTVHELDLEGPESTTVGEAMKKRIMLPIVGALVIVSVGTAKTIVSDELTALLPKTVAEPITLQLAVEEYQKDNSFVEFLDTYCSDTDFVIGYPDEVGGGFSFKDEASSAAEPLVGELLDDNGNVVYRDDQAVTVTEIKEAILHSQQ